MRKPDYDKMREMLAEYDADTIDRSDLQDVLLFGTVGYKDATEDEVMDLFLQIWKPSKLPKIKVEE
tara:strand:- start:2167 stop:2364 length:198 start_codon:yes stop_codon:yes gene_type:complete